MSDISPADWPQVRALFFVAQDAMPADRARLLAADDVPAHVRAHVARLLAASAAHGARYDTSALAILRGTADAARAVDGPLWPDAPSLVGRQLGPYAVRRRVGQGGMGAVYEAERVDGAYDGRVAVKTLWRGADSAVLTRRFRSERRILALLRHPNIAGLLDAGATAEGTPYLVMEYVEGLPIDTFCDAHRLALAARLRLFLDVCAAVTHAHRHLVVHRDLKPGNVLVSADGTPKLLDFGVAKLVHDETLGEDFDEPGTLTGAGFAPFTSGYAAPEQRAGQRASTATDVYALGALLVTLLSGHAPGAVLDRNAADAAARARGIADGRRLARALHGELDAITAMALREEPGRRYATVDALAEDVRRCLRRDRVLARPDTVAYRVCSFARRQRALVAGVGVGALALVAGSGVALWQAAASRREAARAERVAAFLQSVLGTSDLSAEGASLRVGPRMTLAAALDSARARVPLVFAADPRVRARLYTTLGGSYVAQDRAREGEAVLDSAVRLARASYGPHAPAVVEALLEAGLASVRANHFAMADARFDAAAAALPARDTAAVRARVTAARSMLALARAEFPLADSLAARAIAAEERRTRAPSAVRAWALRVLGTVRRDSSDAHFLHAIAIMDSLGAPMAMERLDAMLGHAAYLIGHNLAGADSVLREGTRLADLAYGPVNRESAEFHAYRARVARVRGDARAAGHQIDSAVAILDALPDVVAPVRSDVTGAYLEYLRWQGRWAEVARVAARSRANGLALGINHFVVTGTLYLARADAARGATASALARYDDAIAREPDVAAAQEYRDERAAVRGGSRGAEVACGVKLGC